MSDDLGRWDDIQPQVPRPPVHQLQVQPVRIVSRLGTFSGDQVTMRRFVDAETRHLMVKLETQVLTDRLPPVQVTESLVVEFQRPATWWEHLKDTYRGRWWMRRLVRRRPPRFEVVKRTAEVTVDLRRFRTYPRADVVPPEPVFGRPVFWSESEVRGVVR